MCSGSIWIALEVEPQTCYFFDENERKPVQPGRRQFSLNASLTLIQQQQFESLPNNSVDRGVETQSSGEWKYMKR